MKTWTYDDLYELWRNRGYTKKAAAAKATAELDEMNRKKSSDELHAVMQEMLYN